MRCATGVLNTDTKLCNVRQYIWTTKTHTQCVHLLCWQLTTYVQVETTNKNTHRVCATVVLRTDTHTCKLRRHIRKRTACATCVPKNWHKYVQVEKTHKKVHTICEKLLLQTDTHMCKLRQRIIKKHRLVATCVLNKLTTYVQVETTNKTTHILVAIVW